jgi:hypothetical protein
MYLGGKEGVRKKYTKYVLRVCNDHDVQEKQNTGTLFFVQATVLFSATEDGAAPAPTGTTKQ